MQTTQSDKGIYNLASYALTDKNSKGRKFDEEHHSEDFRSQFQHDRDRILHSKAFRRLNAKTQVILTNESDHSRTRLTHSLEVGQISESIAIRLGLNTFATWAIALGHDLGHAPFGHTGERALNTIARNFGLDGFKHNYQSLLVVNQLEKTYHDYNGLNLLWETRDGILKHSKIKNIDLDYYDDQLTESPKWPSTLEGQIVALVDEIAQRTHDTDDALRSNRISIHDLFENEIVNNAIEENGLSLDYFIQHFKDDKSLAISSLIVFLLKYYVKNTILNSIENIKNNHISDLDSVKNCTSPIISWNEDFAQNDSYYQDYFLKPLYYGHYEIQRMDSRAEFFIKQLFKAFKMHPKQMPKFTHDLFLDGVKNTLTSCLISGSEKNRQQFSDFLSQKKTSM